MGADASKSETDAEQDTEQDTEPADAAAYDRIFRGDVDTKAAFRAAFAKDGAADQLDAIVQELEGQVGDKSKVSKDIQMLEEMAKKQEAKEAARRKTETKKAAAEADTWLEQRVQSDAAQAELRQAEERAQQARLQRQAAEEQAKAKTEARAEAMARAQLFEDMDVKVVRERFVQADVQPARPFQLAQGLRLPCRPELLIEDDMPQLEKAVLVPELYATLQVAVDATFEEIKKAYRKQALLWHPDKNRTRLEEATARFQKINLAFDTLFDPEKRSAYDSGQLPTKGKAKKLTGSGWADVDDEDDLALTPEGVRLKKLSWRSYVITYGRIDDDPEQIIQDDRDPRAPQEKIKIFWRYMGEMAHQEKASGRTDWVKHFILKVWKDTPSRWPSALELQQMNEASQKEWKDRRTVYGRRKQKILIHVELHESYLAIPNRFELEQQRLKTLFQRQSITGRTPLFEDLSLSTKA